MIEVLLYTSARISKLIHVGFHQPFARTITVMSGINKEEAITGTIKFRK